MSQQWLYPIFRISGYRVTKCEAEERCLRLHIEPQPHKVCCAECGSRDCIRRGEQVRLLTNLPVGGIVSFLVVTIPRVECRAGGLVRQISLGLAEARRSYTRSFARYVLELSQLMTIKDVAEHLGVSWDVVKDIQKSHLAKHYARPKLKKVKQIAIDEICIGRGHRFVTIVLDLDRGAILFVGEEKSRQFAAFLAAAASLQSQGRGRSDGPLQGLSEGSAREPAQGHDRVRPLPRRQASEREADSAAPRTVSPGHDRSAQRSAQRHAVAAAEERARTWTPRRASHAASSMP